MKKQQDLSKYNEPFNIDSFIFGTPLTVRKIKLTRDGFQPIILRKKDNNVWEILEHTSLLGDECWKTIKTDFVENYLNSLPENVTLKELL